jgi:hypothetical protein
VIASFNNMEFIHRTHFPSDSLEQLQWAKWIACPLHEKNGRRQLPEYSVSELLRITTAAEWIP